MPGAIHRFLARDHARLDSLLLQATADANAIDVVAYGEFRRGLLRHIAMEEKVLFADLRARSDDATRALIATLHADHAAIASILVPPPTHELIATLSRVLEEHNPLEEDPGGLYDRSDVLAGVEIDAVLARMEAIAPVRASEHLDEPRVHAHIERMLQARARR